MIAFKSIATALSWLLIFLGVAPLDRPAEPAPAPIVAAAPQAVEPESTREIVQRLAQDINWTGNEWDCLASLIHRESSWNLRADNPHSTAFGLFQILDTPQHLGLIDQVERGFRYIETRYGTPCVALTAWLRHERQGAAWY